MRRRFLSKKEPSDVPYEKQYFTLHMLNDGEMTLYVPTGYTENTLLYSINNKKWVNFDSETTLSLKNDDKVRIKCICRNYDRNGVMFHSTCDYEVYGNAMSLFYGDDFKEKVNLKLHYALRRLFSGEVNLVTAENLLLPATTLQQGCYDHMFYDCRNLVKAPQLPATYLSIGGYSHMFCYCVSLVKPPKCSIGYAAHTCCQSMFYGCTSLVEAPELPSTSLGHLCYGNMFYGCTSLTEAPQLPATTLGTYCYSNMFNGCTSLTTAPELPATTLADTCYGSMFQGCTSLTTAPQLLATKLASQCYIRMFNGCSKLNKITMLATDISATNCLSGWVSGVASSGTFVKNPQMTTLPSGTSGIPNGWIVEDYVEPNENE